jgi:bifunctional enzyme CysN/CysC
MPAATMQPMSDTLVRGSERLADRDMLRFSTAGSVDDGKSTLIGRLLLDTKQIMVDQLAHIEEASARQGFDRTELALLTDGLRAEREQGITIDVAYRYFATPRRKFVIADTPGHPQYTRNMVTGASTANLAIVLVDARKGLTEQSRRHAFLSSLLGIPHIVIAVNKMDLVNWSEARFEEIHAEFTEFATKLQTTDISFIPISALHGDNVVEQSSNMPWYQGTPLLYHLEHVHIASDRNLIDVRFPVQWVIRPMSDSHHDYRGYAGTVAGGVLKAGDEVVVLPSGLESTIAAIEAFDGPSDDRGVPSARPIDEAFPPMSAVVRLTDDIDVSRGDMICRRTNRPTVGQDLDAMICWMIDRPLAPRSMWALKQTTRNVRAMVTDLNYRLDVNTLHRDESATELGLNDIGRVQLRATAPLFYDAYERNRATGSFVLIDEGTNTTAAAGMLVERER